MANKTPAQQAYLVILAVVAWLAVVLQIWLVMQTYAARGDSAFAASERGGLCTGQWWDCFGGTVRPGGSEEH